MITTITGKNRVTLPAAIVRSLDLTPGTQLDWEIGPNGTLIASPWLSDLVALAIRATVSPSGAANRRS